MRLFLLCCVIACMVVSVGCHPRKAKPVEDKPREAAGQVTPSEKERETEVKPLEPSEKKPLLETIYFDFDRYNLRDDAIAALTRNAEKLLKNPDVKIVIEGHCDERGTEEYNLALGEKRAAAARDFLVRFGIEKARISTISYGEEHPVDPGHDEIAWAKNRRAEFLAK